VSSTGCLDEDTILGFIEGRLPSEAIARVESHVRACETCQERLSLGLAAAGSARPADPAAPAPLRTADAPSGGSGGVASSGGVATSSPELSCRFLVPLMDLADARVEAGDVAAFLGAWHTGADVLRNESGWVSLRFCEALVEWLAERVGIDTIIDRTLRESYAPKTMGLLYPFVRAFGSPRVGFGRMPSLVRLLNHANDVQVVEIARNRATITYRPLREELRERSPLICRVRRAQIAAGPTIWNLPLAVVKEEECMITGGDRCVYQVSWVEPSRWRRALLVGAAAAILAWLVPGTSWPALVLAGAIGVGGVHLLGALRDLREHRVLEDLKMNALTRVTRLMPVPSAPSATPTPPTLPGRGGPPPGMVLPQPGQLLAGRYRIGPLLGAGGMSFVFSAIDEAVDEPVALKLLRPDLSSNPRWVERMAREVRLARAIAHPNVCRVMSFGRVDDCCFLTMELATGGSLHRELRSGAPPRPWADRLADAKAIVLGLVAVHDAGIVHRDLTPQNILRFSGGRLAITDFGLAVDRPGKTTMAAGTPNYMAPEVLDGAKVSYTSDVWQLGVILHELLYGRRPKWGEAAGGRALVAAPEAKAGGAAGSLFELCAACLHADPDQRPANANAVASRLLAIAG
jgi:hypothetical protein